MTQSLRILIAAVAAAALSHWMTPRTAVSNLSEKVILEERIPRAFGRWREDISIAPLGVDPEVKEKLDTLYSQVLSRTYINTDGQRIMLSIAYGAAQSRALQLHKPEVCYTAQGFQVTAMTKVSLQATAGPIPAMQMVGRNGPRNEPITYWMRIGDEVARGWQEQNYVRLRYGLARRLPDGLLFRVSSISDSPPESFELQAKFSKELLDVLDPETRSFVVGNRYDSSSAGG